jgi:hypothetical protein
MSALLVDGAAAIALAGDLDQVSARASRAYGLDEKVELHGHEIFHADGAWDGVPVRARIGVFDDVIEAVAARDVRVVARAMDIAGQRVRYPAPESPHSVVLQHLLERVDECVTRLGEYALVIADEVDGQARPGTGQISRNIAQSAQKGIAIDDLLVSSTLFTSRRATPADSCRLPTLSPSSIDGSSPTKRRTLGRGRRK